MTPPEEPVTIAAVPLAEWLAGADVHDVAALLPPGVLIDVDGVLHLRLKRSAAWARSQMLDGPPELVDECVRQAARAVRQLALTDPPSPPRRSRRKSMLPPAA